MDWEIYSIGDGAFLERILNSVAMLSGSGNLEQVAAIGFLIGAISLGFKSLMDGGRMPQFQYLLIAWIVYMGMFGSTARVTITDVYKDEVRVVDNVPLGVAASGTLISYTGYKLTELFEQAFSSVNMTDDGFGYALDALADVRKATITQDAWGKANAPRDGMDIWRSWSNYIKECTMVGVDLDQYTIPDIQSGSRFVGANAIQQLRFDSQSYGTRLFIDPSLSGGGFYNCSEAHDRLASVTTNEAIPQLKQNLAAEMGIYDREFAPQGPAAAAEADMKLQGALQVLNQSGVAAQDYMIASAMYPIFQWGMVGNELDYQRAGQASMLHDAIQQRNAQWAAEQALFQSVVHPIMTFFEGFIFAITPFMAFLVALGPVGISIAFKYFFLILWIQLWMPTLSIVNLFLHMSAQREMSAFREGGGYDELKMTSFYGIAEGDMALQNWLSTGGMLASSVPALTLMLLYGSAITATNLSGRLQSGDFIDEKKTAPDTSKVGAATQVQSVGNYDRFAGQRMTGSDSAMPTIATGKSFSSSVRSAQSEAESAQRVFSDALSRAQTNNADLSQESSERLTETLTTGATGSVANRLTQGISSRLSQEGGQSNTISDQTVKKIIGSATVGGTFVGRTGPSAAQDVAQQTGIAQEQVERVLSAYNEELSEDETYQAEMREAVAEDFATGQAESYRTVFGDQTTDQLQMQASEAYSSSKTYEDLKSIQESGQVSQSIGVSAVGKQIANDPGLKQRIENWEKSQEGLQYRGKVEDQERRLVQQFGLTNENARYAAAAQYLASSGTAQGGEFIADLFNAEPTDVTRNTASQNEGGGAPSVNNAEDKAVEALANSPDTPNGNELRDKASSETGSIDGPPENMGDRAQEFFEGQQLRVSDEANSRIQDQTQRLLEESASNIAVGADPNNNGDGLLNAAEGWMNSAGFRSTPGGDLINEYGDVVDGLVQDAGISTRAYSRYSSQFPQIRAESQEPAQKAYEKAQSYVKENFPELTSGMQDYMAYAMVNDPSVDKNPGDLLGAEAASAKTKMAERYGTDNADALAVYFDDAMTRGANGNQIQDAMSGIQNQMDIIRQQNDAFGGSEDFSGVVTEQGEAFSQRRQEVLSGLMNSDDSLRLYTQMRSLPESDQAFIQPEIRASENMIRDEFPQVGQDLIDGAIQQGEAIRNGEEIGISNSDSGQPPVPEGNAGNQSAVTNNPGAPGSGAATGGEAPGVSAPGDVTAGGTVQPAATGGEAPGVSAPGGVTTGGTVQPVVGVGVVAGNSLAGSDSMRSGQATPGVSGSVSTLPSDPMTGTSLQQAAVTDSSNTGQVMPGDSVAMDMSNDMQRQQLLERLESEVGPNSSPEATARAIEALPEQQQQLVRGEYDAALAQLNGGADGSAPPGQSAPQSAGLPSDPMTGSSLAQGPSPDPMPAYTAGGSEATPPPSQRELAMDMSTDMQRQQTLDDLDSRLGPDPSPEAQLRAMDELPLQQQELLRQEYADAEAMQRSDRSWS